MAMKTTTSTLSSTTSIICNYIVNYSANYDDLHERVGWCGRRGGSTVVDEVVFVNDYLLSANTSWTPLMPTERGQTLLFNGFSIRRARRSNQMRGLSTMYWHQNYARCIGI